MGGTSAVSLPLRNFFRVKRNVSDQVPTLVDLDVNIKEPFPKIPKLGERLG